MSEMIDGTPYRELTLGIPGDCHLTKEEEASIKKDVSYVAQFADTPPSQMTQRQREVLVSAKSRLRKKGANLFALAFQYEYMELVFSETTLGPYEVDVRRKTIPKVETILAKAKAPKLAGASAEDLEEVILQVYDALVAVNGALEYLLPAQAELEDLEKRMSQVAKAIHCGTTEWRAASVTRLWIPTMLYQKLMAVQKAVAMLKHRAATLDRCYEMASRLVTIAVDAPTGSIGIARRTHLSNDSAPVSRKSSKKRGTNSLRELTRKHQACK